jgi:hypothetical protein
MEIDELAGRVASLGAEVTGSGARLALADPGPGAFGGDGPGRLGELGRALHSRLRTALAAREREAAAQGARLTDLATALHRAAQGYLDAEDAAHQRHRGVA